MQGFQTVLFRLLECIGYLLLQITAFLNCLTTAVRLTTHYRKLTLNPAILFRQKLLELPQDPPTSLHYILLHKKSCLKKSNA